MTTNRATYELGRDSGTRPEMGQGWASPTEVDTWTNAPTATLVVPTPTQPVDHFIVLRTLIRPDMPEQRVRLSVRGAEVGQFTVPDRVMRAARIPAALLGREPALPITLHLDDDAVALGSIALQADIDTPPPPPADTDPSDRAMMMRFESLGENCEFGLAQRAAGAEPLGLMRFASTDLQRLLIALDSGFAGLGAPDKVEIEISDNGREYMVKDRVFGLYYHAWVKAGAMPPEEVHCRELRRLPFLIRKLTEDLQSGHKIFVRKERGGEPDSIVYPLLPALRRWGPNTLLYVKLADAAHPPGTVERREPGLLVGYIERFAPGEDAHDFLPDQWLAICRAAQTLVWPELAGQPPHERKPPGQLQTTHEDNDAQPARGNEPRPIAPHVSRRPPRALLSCRLGFRLQNGGFESMNGAGRSIASLLQLEAPPFWARLILGNDGTEPCRLDGAALAPTDAAGDEVAPAGTWRRVTFDSLGADTEPLDRRPGTADTLTIPPASDPTTPTRVLSDWIGLPGTARSDGGRGALLMVRNFASATQRYPGFGGRPHHAVGQLHAGFWAHGDGTRPPWGTEWHRFDRLSACWGLQYITAIPGATVVGIGDGVVQGLRTTGQVSGFGPRACAAISRPDLPVSWFNEGHAAHGSADYARAGLWAIETLQPQVALIQTWTANDPATEDAAEAALSRAVALSEATRRCGGIPILLTAAPAFAEDSPAEAIRRTAAERVRRCGAPVLDLDAIWGDGGLYQPDFDGGDHRHPSDHACAVAGQALALLLSDLLGAR